MRIQRRFGFVLILAFSSACFLTSGSSAQSRDERSQTSGNRETATEVPLDLEQDPMDSDAFLNVEEIVISGQSASTVGQDEAVSAVGFSQEDLLLDGITDIRDLSNYTPNLEVKTAFAAVNPTIFIRGVGLDDFNANSASAVSVIQDGVYMNSPAGQLFGLYDVKAVEVLRGPQPTVMNASAGAILVSSREPTQNFESYFTASFGVGPYQTAYDMKEFQGAINVPISEAGSLAARIAFSVNQRGGTTHNRCGALLKDETPFAELGSCIEASGLTQAEEIPGPTEVREWVNDRNNWAGRFMLSGTAPLWGGHEVDWLLNLNGGQNRGLAAQFQHTGLTQEKSGTPFYNVNRNGAPARDSSNYRQEATRGDNFAGEYDRVGPEKLQLAGGSLRADWQYNDSIRVESLTGFFWHYRATYANDDGNPKVHLNDDFKDHAWQIYQTLAVDWLWGDENLFKFGGDFLREDLNGANILRAQRNGEPTFDQKMDQNTTQWGVYVVAHYEFLENFFIDASVRFNWAEKDFAVDALGISTRPGGVDVTSKAGQAGNKWNAWTGDVALNYRLSDSKTVYAKFSRGWKAGHFNGGTIYSSEALTPVSPEYVNLYEGGLRTEWLDGQLMVNLTGFAQQYADLQVFQVTTDSGGFVLRRLINANNAGIRGVELEFAYSPLEGLDFMLNGAYLDTEYLNFGTSFERKEFAPGSGFVDIIVDVDYSGNSLVAAPDWAFSGSAQYRVPIGAYGEIMPRLSFAYKDTMYFDPNEGFGGEGNIAQQLIKQPAYWIVNASLTYTVPGSQFEVTGFVRNIANENYKVQSFDFSNERQLLLDVYGDPRTAGVMLTFNYY